MGKDPQDIIKQQKKQGLEKCVEPHVCTCTQGHMPKAGGLGGLMEAHTRNQEEGGWD